NDQGSRRGRDKKSIDAKSHQKNRRKKDSGKGHSQNPGSENGRADVLQDLSQKECVERRLVVPDFGVEFEALETESSFRERETFVPTDLYRCAEGKQGLKKNECRQ